MKDLCVVHEYLVSQEIMQYRGLNYVGCIFLILCTKLFYLLL